jgi:hypothetical protein
VSDLIKQMRGRTWPAVKNSYIHTHTVLHLRSVPGNLNNALWARTHKPLEICAFASTFSLLYLSSSSRIKPYMMHACSSSRLSGHLTHVVVGGIMQCICYYRKLTGESDISVRHHLFVWAL